MNLNIIRVALNQVKIDSTLESIFRYAKNPNFFVAAIKQNSYYTIPPAYEKEGNYYILGFYRSLDAISRSGETEISVNLIELTEAKILEFLLCFQYQEHKETRCMAEMIRVFLNFKASPAGKDWLKQNVNSQIKEKQISQLFGVSTFGAKCYLKLLQPAHNERLEKLGEDYSLYMAYNDCNDDDSRLKKSTSNTATSDDDTDNSSEPVVVRNTPQKQTASASKIRAEQPENVISKGELDSHLANFKNRKHATTDVVESQPSFAKKAIVVLQDDTCIEVPGKVEIRVDNIPIGSTEQLTKKSDGTWSLPKNSTPISLLIYSNDDADDFFSEF